VAERPATEGGGASDQGTDPHPISREMGREAGKEARAGATTAAGGEHGRLAAASSGHR